MEERRIPTPFPDSNTIISRFNTKAAGEIKSETNEEKLKRLKLDREKIDSLISICDKPDGILFQRILMEYISDLAQNAYANVMCSAPDYIREQNIGYIRGLTDVKEFRSVLKMKYDAISTSIRELQK